MSAVSVKRGVWQRWKRIFILTYPALGIIGLYNWIDWKSAAFFIGTLTLLHTPSFGKNPVRGFRWGWLTIAFSIGFLFLPVKIMLYLGLVSAVLLFRETFYRPTEPSVPIVLLLMTPLAEYFVRLFSFPVRLQLTLLASRIIGITGQSVTATGNILTWRGQDFSVDPACIGLHMLVASLLTALLLSNHYQKKYRVRLHPMLLFLLLGIVLGLNIVANLLRITLLVILMILPENPMHGFLGLMVWLIYVLLPMIPLIRWMTPPPGEKNGGGDPYYSTGAEPADADRQLDRCDCGDAGHRQEPAERKPAGSCFPRKCRDPRLYGETTGRCRSTAE